MVKSILVDVHGSPEAYRRLQAVPGIRVEAVEPDETGRRTLPRALLAQQHALVCMYPPLNIADMASLEWVQLASSGYSQLFGLGLAERGVRAANCRGNVDVPIAEWNLAMMLNLARDVPDMLRNQSQRLWRKEERYSREIRGLAVGIWGYGCIGRETARLARAFGMRVRALDRHFYTRNDGPLLYEVPGTGDPDAELPEAFYSPGEEERFLRGLDYLVLTMPLTERTRGIVGERELRALPPHAYVLNPARGPLIAEDALLRALREGWIAGAALDTHYYYPMPPEHPLWTMPNVVMTPHVAGSPLTPHFRERLWEMIIANAERFAEGRPLLNELSPEQLLGR
ncbi:MAG: D-2-hydroxyacid dehydrogenase [Paenibacillaceae bacterium]|nr:D-2-hydroxyacid dehydrogenase [Paenibacillaceae bacterium]